MNPLMRNRDEEPVNVLPHPEHPLRFWIDRGEGVPYGVDLTEFTEGGRREDQPPRLRERWVRDFGGRPKFARAFAEVVSLTRPSEESFKAWRHSIRVFFRFLDEEQQETGRQVTSIEDITDALGPKFRIWCEMSGAGTKIYSRVKTACDRMREFAGLHPLFWPARPSDPPSLQEPVDELGMRRLFNSFKKEAIDIKAMFCEGERLAISGNDPRGARADQGFLPAGWHRRENHAWLVREMTRDRLPNRRELLGSHAQGLITANDAATQKHDGPAYLVPGMSERGRQGIVGKLRWFHPSYHDTGVFLWLFLIGTGWNLATALALDVSDEENWVDDHPQRTDFKILHAFKERADRHQFTISMEKPEWHPYRIVRFMIERTKILRATLRHRLAAVLEKKRSDSSPALDKEVAEIEAALRSPWLYHVVNKTGAIGAFHHSDSMHLNDLARAVAIKHNLLQQHPTLAQITTAIARDAWIGYAYVKTGYHVLMTRLASQHATARTLKHYLNRRRHREHSEVQIRKWQNAAFAELSGGRPIDPTRLRLLVQNGAISAEQEARLLDLRKRTRLGMGCLDPTHPPVHIAPDHKEGALCRVQRCTGCHFGVVFEESLVPLARAYAELLFLRRQIPLATWSGSSLEDEFVSLETTLKNFDSVAVTAEVDAWLAKLKAREVVPHDIRPSY
jgi:hypothetical protein